MNEQPPIEGLYRETQKPAAAQENPKDVLVLPQLVFH
jgi:hypothetical protein